MVKLSLHAQFYINIIRQVFRCFTCVLVTSVYFCIVDSHVMAQSLLDGPKDCAEWGNISVNEVYKYNPTQVLGCIIAEGADPPKEWLCRESGFCSAPTAKIFARILQPITPAHRPPTKYQDDGCPYYEPVKGHGGTKAGGAYGGGATDACDIGVGDAASPNVVVEASIPEVNDEQVDCISNLFGSLTSAFSGSGEGNIGIGGAAASGVFNAGGVSGSGSASVGSGGACVSGNIGICGMSLISGNVCVGSGNSGSISSTVGRLTEPFVRSDPPTFVPVNGIIGFDYPPNNINIPNTGVWAHRGALVTINDPGLGNMVFEIPEDGFITYDDRGFLHIGSHDGLPDIETDVDIPPGLNPFNGGLNLNAKASVTVNAVDGMLSVGSELFAANTVGKAGETTRVSTVQAASAANEGLGKVNLFTTPNNGPTLQPNYDPTLVGGVAGGPNAGAFPPDAPAIQNRSLASTNLDTSADAVLQDN